jgi:hypothetical protein
MDLINNISQGSYAVFINDWLMPNRENRELQKNERSNTSEKTKTQAKDTFSKSAELSDREKQIVEELRRRDEAVRRHEQAHIAAGGSLVRGAANYSYQIGPDGKQYAVGGEVQIDISPEDTPEATIRKMQQVQRAALAPSDPSPQDRAVAAMASRIEMQAAMEARSSEDTQSSNKLLQKKQSENSNKSSSYQNNTISPQAKLALAAYRKAETF